MSVVSIYCKENFHQWDEHGEEYCALKEGKTYVGGTKDGVITVQTVQNSHGEPVMLQFLIQCLPTDFIDVQ